MSSIFTEREFKRVFLEAVTGYIEALNAPNKCLTDNFVELARAAAFNANLPWHMQSLQLTQLFEVCRTSPVRREEILAEAVKLYTDHHFNNKQVNLPLEE
jgi:hypothetical protein